MRAHPGNLLLVKERFRFGSLRFKIAFFIVLLLTSTSFILCIVTVQIMNNSILDEIIKRGESVSKSIAASAGYSLLSGDLLGLDNLVFKAKISNNDMEYVAVVTSDAKAIAHSEASMSGTLLPNAKGRVIRKGINGTTVKELPRSSDSIFEIACPIVFMKKNMGTVMLAINKSVLVEAQGKVGSRI